MYIKIKRIKQTFLILGCLFLAGFNYFTYVIAADSANNSTTCNKTVDADCDGLTDAEEKLYKTNSSNSDTDGDGYSDGVEVKSGYDPTKKAPGDKVSVLSSQTTSPEDAIDNASTTNTFSQDLQDFISSKGDKPITNADINDFVSTNLAAKTGDQITVDTLPEIDVSSIKVLDQDYTLLSADEKKKQIQADSSEYFNTLIYLLISNSPETITSKEDLTTFSQDFTEHVSSLSSTSPDYDYFSDLGNRLDIFLNQLQDITVPETIIPIHTKMIRIIKGFLQLRETSTSSNDPVSKMALLSKIQTLTKISTDFIGNDVANYFNQF